MERQRIIHTPLLLLLLVLAAAASVRAFLAPPAPPSPLLSSHKQQQHQCLRRLLLPLPTTAGPSPRRRRCFPPQRAVTPEHEHEQVPQPSTQQEEVGPPLRLAELSEAGGPGQEQEGSEGGMTAALADLPSATLAALENSFPSVRFLFCLREFW